MSGPPGKTGAVAGPTSTKSPKSIHIREANGGFIVAKHGGNDDSFSGQDHVAKSFNHAIRLAKEHMGGGSVDATPDTEGSAEDMGENEKSESKAEADDKPKPKAAKGTLKKRDHSETY